MFAAVIILFLGGATIAFNSLSQPESVVTIPEPVTQGQDSAPTPTTPTPSETSVVTGITLSEVATHNSATSCYVAISGSVYDVTSFVNKHPGGPSRILKQCGTDATEEFMDQHGGDSRPESTLATFKIAALAN